MAMSLSALYVCVACSVGAVPDDEADDMSQIPTVSSIDGLVIARPAAALPVTTATEEQSVTSTDVDDAVAGSEVFSPFKVVSVEAAPLGETAPTDSPSVEIEPDTPPVEIEPDTPPVEIEPDTPPVEIEPDTPPVEIEPDPSEIAGVDLTPSNSTDAVESTSGVDDTADQTVSELDEQDPLPVTDYSDTDSSQDSDLNSSSTSIAEKEGSKATTFAEIASRGLDNACYLDDDHYVAEFMFQNPDVCFWELDSADKTVTAVATPTPPSDAIQLPAPSGVNDTAMLESFINAHAGESLVGQGTYKVNGLDINVPVDIFNMPMEPASGAGKMVIINTTDVRIFSSPIDAKGSSSVYIGFYVSPGSHRFTLVDSGFSNIHHKKDENASGVYIRGADDFYLACNNFENIINDTDRSDKTARANSIWMNGGHDESTSGGYIVNNTAYNHQSNGKLKDSEFFTQQSYVSTSVDNPVKIFGNQTLDAGKRFTKHQEDNAKVLSNDHEWSVKSGPLGNRLLLAHVTVQFSDNIIARNNRAKIRAGSRFDYVFITQVHYGTKVQDNVHYDCNDIEITDQLKPSSNSIPHIITARMPTKPKDSTGFEATNSSASFNRVHGDGSVRYFYNFDQGYAKKGGRFATEGNVFEIDYLNAIYKN